LQQRLKELRLATVVASTVESAITMVSITEVIVLVITVEGAVDNPVLNNTKVSISQVIGTNQVGVVGIKNRVGNGLCKRGGYTFYFTVCTRACGARNRW